MSGHSTHASLLSRVRDPSDDAAWVEFDDRYRDLILRYCHRRGLSYWDAEDVRQTVMASLLGALKSFRYDPERGRFRSYLGRAVTRAIQRHFSRPTTAPSGLRAGTGGAAPPVEEAADPRRDSSLDAWDLEWRDHHLRLALDHVRRETKDRTWTLCERLLEGKDVPAVAAEFSVSADAVYKAGQRLRARLLRRLAAQLRDEDDGVLPPG